jgi:hypothetical protein
MAARGVRLGFAISHELEALFWAHSNPTESELVAIGNYLCISWDLVRDWFFVRHAIVVEDDRWGIRPVFVEVIAML